MSPNRIAFQIPIASGEEPEIIDIDDCDLVYGDDDRNGDEDFSEGET